MADFDGNDDIMEIKLPAWCADERMMSVLWIDLWLMTVQLGKVKRILIDAYSGDMPRFRWYLEGTSEGDFVKLVLNPGPSEVEVKTWELEDSFLGTWHHVAFTLRMARQYTSTSDKPELVVTQAFCFLDGKPLTDKGTFVKLDYPGELHKQLVFRSGLSSVYLGGVNPQRKDIDKKYQNFKGAVDNVRIWWPPCPHEEDPTKCNPWAFLYPKLIDGTPSPASGIFDNEVTLVHVAKPVLTYMFKLAPQNTNGLLAQFSFDGPKKEHILYSESKWSGPSSCDVDDVCPGCNEHCVFDECNLFDAMCVEAGAKSIKAQAEYAISGKCQCLNVQDCPQSIENCRCPPNKGLTKVCTSCHIGICKVSIPEPSAHVQRVSPQTDGSYGCESGTETTKDGKSSGIILDGPGAYGSYAECEWRLVTAEPDVTKIALTIDFVDMEKGYDYLIIESCKQENCADVETLVPSGTEPSAGIVYTSPTGFLRLRMTSDNSVQNQGFSATWIVSRQSSGTIYPGEGTSCHPGTAPSPGYPVDGPVLQPCPNDPTRSSNSSSSPMDCKPLDPMFCPDSMFCTEWDCKCYGPGNNDNTTISGTLGTEVRDPSKDSLFCACPQYQENITHKKDMENTTMPFTGKADLVGVQAMPYECCHDWFVGFQCTLWDRSTGSTPVCLSMYEDSPLRKCSTTTCCSNYTYVYQDFAFGSGGGSDGGPFGSGSGGSGGSDGAYPYGYGGAPYDGYGYDGGYEPPPPPPYFSGSSSGSGSTGGSGSGSSCTMTISTSGTFVGQFTPAGSRRSDINNLRMIEGVMFRGTFVPDSDASSVSPSSLNPIPPHETLNNAIHHHDFSSSKDEPPGTFEKDGDKDQKIFRPKSRPGGPGGRKALLDAQKLSQRRGSGGGGERALRDAQKHSQRRGSEDRTNAGASASPNSSNTTTDVTMDDWKTMRGRLQIQLQDSWGWCADRAIQDPTDYDIFAKVKDWILLVLNDEGNFSYAATDITVQEVSDAYTIGNFSIGPRASRASSSIWTYLVSTPDCRSPGDCQECVGRKNITLNVVFIQVKDKDHRRKIADILTADLFKRPLPNDGISTPRANVTCPIQGASACTCQPSSDISSGDIFFGASVLDDCAWIIAAGTNGAINVKVSALTPGVPIWVYQCSTSSCQWGPPTADCGFCGDANRDAGEACDDGNVVSDDGCSDTCTVESGYTCNTDTPNVCTGLCGDSNRDAGEACDDGNVVSDDGCSDACTVESGYTCNTDTPNVCTGLCGDANRDAGEACDDGNVVSDDGCSDACTVESGYTCNTDTPNVCTATGLCGDANRDAGEACDDENVVSYDGCSDTCTVESGYTCNTDTPNVCTGPENLRRGRATEAGTSERENVVRSGGLRRGGDGCSWSSCSSDSRQCPSCSNYDLEEGTEDGCLADLDLDPGETLGSLKNFYKPGEFLFSLWSDRHVDGSLIRSNTGNLLLYKPLEYYVGGIGFGFVLNWEVDLKSEFAFPGSRAFTRTRSKWIDAPKAAYCGDGIVEQHNNQIEECDEGLNMGAFSACNTCSCTKGSTKDTVKPGCICTPTLTHTGASIDAVEATSVQGELNNVTFMVQLTQRVTGLNDAGENTDPVVVTISGLQAATATGDVPISCEHSMQSKWTDAAGMNTCKLGLAPMNGLNASYWRYNFAEWNQEDGTLKFIVLGKLDSGVNALLRTFKLTVALRNHDTIRPEQRPEVSVCKYRASNESTSYRNLGLYDSEQANGALSSTGYILGSRAKILLASNTTQSVKFTTVKGGRTTTTLQVTVPGGSMPAKSKLVVYLKEQAIDKGIPKEAALTLPYQNCQERTTGDCLKEVLAGVDNAMFQLTLLNSSRAPVDFHDTSQVQVELGLDQEVTRKRGGCYTPESNILTVCLPGYVGLFKYMRTRNRWQFVPDIGEPANEWPGYDSRSYSILRSNLSDNEPSSVYVALAVSPCSDYSAGTVYIPGNGRSGGDMICSDGDYHSTEIAELSLGTGAVSKMPSLPATSRPQIGDFQTYSAYQEQMSGDSAMYEPRRVWERVDLSTYDPPPSLSARYGHAMAVVSGTRVLIYGGFGCSKLDTNSSGFCLELELLNDLWEFDCLKLSGDVCPLTELVLSPSLAGIAGHSIVVILGESHRLLVIGGVTATNQQTLPYPIMELMGVSQTMSVDSFEFRELLFRGAKAINIAVSGVEALSFSSATSNETHVVIFAGYLGNSRTSVLFSYSLAESSPDLGLKPMAVLASGPRARSHVGVALPDATTLLVYGGVITVTQNGVLEEQADGTLWQFDLNTQAWLRVHITHNNSDTTQPSSRAYAGFAIVKNDQQTFFLSFGGLLAGFHKDFTFKTKGIQIDGEDFYQVTNEGWVYPLDNSQMTDPKVREKWIRFRPTYSGGTPACCNYEADCPKADRGIGCAPDARAFHTINPGNFFVGRKSIVMYGGLDRMGNAMGDLWQLDQSVVIPSLSFYIILSNISARTWTGPHETVLLDQVQNGWGIPDTKYWKPSKCKDSPAINIFARDDGSGFGLPENTLIISFSAPEELFHNCMLPVMSTAGALEMAVNYTHMKGVLLETKSQSLTGDLYEILMPWSQFRSNEWCNTGVCSRALCQNKLDYSIAGANSPEYPDGQFAAQQTVDETGLTVMTYCYDDKDSDGKNDYAYTWTVTVGPSKDKKLAGQCNVSNYFCASPSKRHGHSSVTLLLGGDTILMLVGGESGSWAQNTELLTMDVHAAYFKSLHATWAKLLTTDREGKPCKSDSTQCPQPRRDPSVGVIGNTQTNNGRLILYGGLGKGVTGKMTTSVGRAYLLGQKDKDVVALADLWYLDLTPLTIECMRGADKCQPLKWILIDVPGVKPVGRWGAGVVLDPSDNLFILGGTTTGNRFTVLGDMHSFQLRDPYFKHCSATGAGLVTAVAAVVTPFYIQCLDAFGDPANSASLRVDITGKEGQPDMKPVPFQIGSGQYKVEYFASRTGQYEVRIYVGRGGKDYQDVIEGYDEEPNNDKHEFNFQPGMTMSSTRLKAQSFYVLTVSPGITNAAVSAAVGDFITGTTAGVIGSFLITSKDAFGNRRPGGDNWASLMVLWNEVSDEVKDVNVMPETGSVSDNKDGSYGVSYRITRAGKYMHTIVLSGTIGAQTPVFLKVVCDIADPSRTYVYGDLLKLETGKASNVYVQTRDQFGNNMRFTPEESPCTGYPLTETCNQVIDYEMCKLFEVPCQPENKQSNFGKSLQYARGSSGALTGDAGEPFYGLYQITVYPFQAAAFLPLVWHNGTYVECYFDSVSCCGPVGTAEADPGWKKANDCYDQIKALSVRRGITGYESRRRGAWAAADSMGVVRKQDHIARVRKQVHIAQATRYEEVPPGRRADAATSKPLDWRTTKLEIKDQFVAPDTSSLAFWSKTAPILCALIAFLMALIGICVNLHEERRRNKIMDNSRSANEAESLAVKKKKKNKKNNEVETTERVLERMPSQNTSERVPTPNSSTLAPQSGDHAVSFDSHLDDISEISEKKPNPVQPMPPDPCD